MGFRPNYFTCIAHLYLYYTLLVFSHEEIQYLYSTLILVLYFTYIFSWRNTIYTNLPVFLTWYQSHSSDLFLAVLSLLVLFHSQHRFRHHNSHCSLSLLNLRCLPSLSLGSEPAAVVVEESNTAQITTHVIPPRLLLQSNFWWYHWDRLEMIYPSVKALPSSELPCALTRRLNFLRQRTTRHAPRATRAVQSSSWRHPWHHLLHVSPSCVSICHLMTSAPHHLGDVICWPLTVDFDWLLTFSVQVLLTQFFA